MGRPNAPYPVAFPVKGMHEGVGYDIQPPGTTSDAINVRGYDTLQRRLRGGRRAGTSKYYAGTINGSEVIQTLAKAVQGTAYVSQDPDAGPTVAIDDNFLSYTASVPTYLGSNWVYQACGVSSASNPWVNSLPPANWGVDANGLVLDGIKNATNNRYQMVPCRFPGPNSVVATMRARPTASSSNTSTGAADDAQCFGPFIRGDVALGSFVFACLIRNGADTACKFRISYKSTIAESILTEVDVTLSGSATVNNNMQISLTEDLATNNITARLIWPGSGLAGADIDVSLSLPNETSSNSGKRRWGLGVYTRAQLNLAAGTKFRTFKRAVSLAYTDDSTAPLAWSFANTDAGTNRYIVPSGVTAQRLVTSGANSTQVGPYDSGSVPANSVPALDTSSDVFLSSSTNPVPTRSWFFRSDPLLGGGPFDPEVTLRGSVSVADTPVVMGVRWNAAFTDGLDIAWTLQNPPTSTYSTTGVMGLDSVIVRRWVAGVLQTGTSLLDSSHTTPVHKDSKLRVQDDGSSLSFWIDNNKIEDILTTAVNAGQTYTAIGCVDNSGGASDSSIVKAHNWRQRSASSDTLPLGSTSSAKLIIASGGSIYGLGDGILTAATNGNLAMTAERHQIVMQSGYNRTFMVDGTRSKVYNLTDNTVANWAATAGTLPAGGRLLALYRGRMVISGVLTDPHNYFMSKLGDPFDFDYSPATTSVIQAVAGNNADAGLIGDIITALIPCSDDTLIFGGDHTIYRMTGDPAAGGTVDMVSDQTGIAFGHAWAKDPSNTLFFWGNDGIYRWTPNTPLTSENNITKGRIDSRIAAVDLAFNRVFMDWNYQHACLVVLIVPSNITTATRVLVWDSRSDAWWEDSYPAGQGPNCLFPYDSGAASDTAFILGGRDGYLRFVDDAAEDDDGTAITSRVRFTPFIADNHASEVVLNEVMPILAAGSGAVNLDVYTGQTAEQCQTAANPRVRRVLAHAGRNMSMRQKVRGYAVQLAVSQVGSSRWALEGLTVGFDGSGKPRREMNNAS